MPTHSCILVQESVAKDADDMTLYIENAEDATKNLINESSKVAGYMINMHKLIIFLCSLTMNILKMKLRK